MRCQPLDLGTVGPKARPDHLDRRAVTVIHPDPVIRDCSVGIAFVTQSGLHVLQARHHGRRIEEPVVVGFGGPVHWHPPVVQDELGPARDGARADTYPGGQVVVEEPVRHLVTDRRVQLGRVVSHGHFSLSSGSSATAVYQTGPTLSRSGYKAVILSKYARGEGFSARSLRASSKYWRVWSMMAGSSGSAFFKGPATT